MKSNFRKSFLIILLSLFSVCIFAATFYVDHGNTSPGDGSMANPFKTIQQAANIATSGDTVIVHGGIYREQVIIKNNGVAFIPFTGEKVVINGTEMLLNWENVSGSIYKAYMNWNVTEGTQSNQVFMDGEMLQLARWPENTGTIVLPTNAYADDVAFDGATTIIYDADFKEGSSRWDGAFIWINLSRSHNGLGWDGQGWTGKVLSTYNGRIVVQGNVSSRIGDEPWGMGPNLEYYLFNPYQPAVNAFGGISNYLKKNEWWKTGDTLFVRMPEGKVPASVPGQSNVIEAKKRIWAFSPDPPKVTFANTSITGFNLFASSITTDLNPLSRTSAATNASNNVIDGINALYVTHFIDQTGDWQVQWDSKSGIILSGINSVIKNCTIQYSAAAAICVMGKNNKVLNNMAFDCNYASTETGVINTGSRTMFGQDHEIAYNTVFNTPQQAFSVEHNDNSDKRFPGKARIHHNLVHDFMLKTHDSGGFDVYGIDGNWTRWDHNILYNSTNYVAIGMYCDFGRGVIMDHNLMWNIDRPIQLNYKADMINGPFLVFSNTVLSDVPGKPGIQNGVGNFGPGFNVQNNISTSTLIEKDYGPWVFSNFPAKSVNDYTTLFTDYKTFDYTLKSTATGAIDKGEFLPFTTDVSDGMPDLGCYEYGADKWEAGTGKLKPEFVISDSAFFLRTELGQSASWTFPAIVLPYSGFEGEVSLSLGEFSSGITAFVSTDKINPETPFTVTIQADNSVHVGKYSVILTGKSGPYADSRVYVIEIPQRLTSVKITSIDTILTKGQTVKFQAVALDQEQNAMRIQPVISFSVKGGGQINNNGLYYASQVSDSVLIISKSTGLSDTLHIRVIDVNTSILPAEALPVQIQVAPNPCDHEVNVRYYSAFNCNAQVLLYDILMNKVYKNIQRVQQGNNTFTVPVSDLKTWLYFLIIDSQEVRSMERILVNHF